jgi:hypothetical protein
MLLIVRATVVTASGVDLRILIDALRRVDTQDISVFTNSIGDSSLFEPSPDFVVGVLSPVANDPQQGLTNLDVMLRIGRSAEKQIPTLLIVPPPLLALSPMADVAIAYCPTDNEAALTLHISAIVAIAASRGNEADNQTQIRVKAGLSGVIEYLGTKPDLSVIEFENILKDILTSDQGTRAIASQLDTGVDLIVSPAGAPDSVVLVQAKRVHVNPQLLVRSAIELHNRVIGSHAGLGLLVFYDRQGPELAPRSFTPLVVSISLKSLAEQLFTQDLLQVLIKATAEAVGGGVIS